MKPLAALIMIVACACVSANPVVYENTWTEKYSLTSATPTLVIENIWGDVKVKAGAGNEFVITVHERRSAENQTLLDESRTLIPLSVQADSEAVTIIVGERDTVNKRRRNQCRNCRAEYNFDVQVPADAKIDVSTVVDGEVVVEGVHNVAKAANVNGPIVLNNIQRCEFIKSINRSVEILFARSPDRDCDIDTINGDMTIVLPDKADLNAQFKINNGTIKSDFEFEPLLSAPTVDQYQHNGRNVYRIEKNNAVRIGGGGSTLSFISLNGDVQLRKTK